MRNGIGDSLAGLTGRWPAWQVWYVPRATGKPAVTWHARRRDGTGAAIHDESPGGLEEQLEASGEQ